MGQAIINSGGPTGLYDVTLVKDAGTSAARLASIASRLSALTGLISTAATAVTTSLSALSAAQVTLNAAVAAMTDTAESRKAVTDATTAVIGKQTSVVTARIAYASLMAEQKSLQKEQASLQAAMATETRTGVWCADLTEDLSVGETVGTIEVNGVATQIIIMPGGTTTGAIGKLQHAGVSTGAAVFYNKALLPCWQKWKPTYRIGTITEIGEDNTCSVGIEGQSSSEQGLPINQDGAEYVGTKNAVSGFSDFAAANPNFPLVTETGDTQIATTAQLLSDLNSVNEYVNSRYNYKRDIDQYGKLENWALMEEGGSGDCEDQALTKAKKLLDLGYPASAIKIEVGTTLSGEGHAWLVVQTDKGDVALDNSYMNVVPNGSLSYINRSRQTGTNWNVKGVLLENVEIDYMDGLDSDAFEIGDRVVVAFTDQDWTKPKVIGFETNPRATEDQLVIVSRADYVDEYHLVISRYKLLATTYERIEWFSYYSHQRWDTGYTEPVDWDFKKNLYNELYSNSFHLFNASGVQETVAVSSECLTNTFRQGTYCHYNTVRFPAIYGDPFIWEIYNSDGELISSDSTTRQGRRYYVSDTEWFETAETTLHYKDGSLIRSYDFRANNLSHKEKTKEIIYSYFHQETYVGDIRYAEWAEVRYCADWDNLSAYTTIYTSPRHEYVYDGRSYIYLAAVASGALINDKIIITRGYMNTTHIFISGFGPVIYYPTGETIFERIVTAYSTSGVKLYDLPVNPMISWWDNAAISPVRPIRAQ